LEATYLFAARWALAERDAPEALRWLDSLRQGAARRTLALRLRLKAARLGHQPEVALDTARLLAKHGAFAESAAQTLRRELAILALDQTRDVAQLQKCWDRLDPQDRSTPEVAQRAARLWLSFEGEPSLALKWLEPLWQRMLQQPGTLDDAQRSRTAHLLAEVLGRNPPDSQWLANIERARQAYPRWVELQYLAGMVCWQHALWGKAQQMLQQAAPHLHEPEMRRNAWRTLALLAEQRDDPQAAQPLWRRAAEA
jgi:HemY protein